MEDIINVENIIVEGIEGGGVCDYNAEGVSFEVVNFEFEDDADYILYESGYTGEILRREVIRVNGNEIYVKAVE